MSNIVEDAPQTQSQNASSGSFHLRMAYASSILLIVSVAGCRLTSIRVADISGRALAVLTASAMLLPLPAYWHQKHRKALRDSALILPWALLLTAVLPFPLLIAARLHMPLKDSFLAGIDESLGISVPRFMAWAGHGWLGTVLDKSYGLLVPLLLLAIFAPVLAGKLTQVKEFVAANLIAFALALPLFALLPAVGPWYYYHFSPGPAQASYQAQLFSLRLPGAYAFLSQGAGIVTFPSFHVIWAILATAALWGFRWLRVPISALAGMIITSTMSTGWHYFSDVLGGMAVAALSILLAKVCRPGLQLHRSGTPPQRSWMYTRRLCLICSVYTRSHLRMIRALTD